MSDRSKSDVLFSDSFESSDTQSGRVVTTTNAKIHPVSDDQSSPLCSSSESLQLIAEEQDEVLILMVIKNQVTAWGSDGLLSNPELVLFRAADRVLEKTLGFGV